MERRKKYYQASYNDGKVLSK